MVEINSKQRKKLEKLAHPLEPVVIVGQAGVTDNIIGMVKECLNTHELIKVKYNEYQDQKFDMTKQITDGTDATLVRVIGNIAILYRPSDDEDNRKIKL